MRFLVKNLREDTAYSTASIPADWLLNFSELFII